MNQLNKHNIIVNPPNSNSANRSCKMASVKKAEESSFDYFDAKLGHIIFFCITMNLVMTATVAKYYVDVCLGASTGSVFANSHEAPTEVCQVIQQKDAVDRNALISWVGKDSLFSRAELKTLLRNPVDIIISPTIFLSDVTHQPQLLWWGVLIVLTYSLVIHLTLINSIKVLAKFTVRKVPPRYLKRKNNSANKRPVSGLHWTTWTVANG